MHFMSKALWVPLLLLQCWFYVLSAAARCSEALDFSPVRSQIGRKDAGDSTFS